MQKKGCSMSKKKPLFDRGTKIAFVVVLLLALLALPNIIHKEVMKIQTDYKSTGECTVSSGAASC